MVMFSARNVGNELMKNFLVLNQYKVNALNAEQM